MKIAEQLGMTDKPTFVQGALYTLPQTNGKQEFRLVSPSQEGLPYVTHLRNGTLKNLCQHHSHQYRVMEDQHDAFILKLEDYGEMDVDTAPATVVLTGKEADRLRAALASGKRY